MCRNPYKAAITRIRNTEPNKNRLYDCPKNIQCGVKPEGSKYYRASVGYKNKHYKGPRRALFIVALRDKVKLLKKINLLIDADTNPTDNT